MPLDLYRVLTILAALASCAWLAGCDPAPQQALSVGPAPQAQPATTDLANPHFAVAIQQGGRKVPLRDHVAAVPAGPMDLVFAFPAPDGVFVHASLSDELYARAAAGEAIEESLPLKGVSEFASSTLLLDAPGWQYWYYFGGEISKFTDVREIQAGGQRVWACKKSLAGVARVGQDKPVPLSDLKGRSLYLVLVKADWDASHTRRVAQVRETLRIDLQ